MPTSRSASTCIAAGSPPIATCSAATLLGLYFMWASSLAENGIWICDFCYRDHGAGGGGGGRGGRGGGGFGFGGWGALKTGFRIPPLPVESHFYPKVPPPSSPAAAAIAGASLFH